MLYSLNIKDQEFNQLKDLVYKRFGISLSDKKKTLVKGRLQTTLKELGFTTFSEYYDFLIQDKTGTYVQNFIDKISTNHTFFFRENDHFEFMYKQALPFIKENNYDKEIRIWSAGCSSGEEPYTIAIVLDDFFKNDLRQWTFRVLATDISLTMLKNAQTGIFKEERLKNVQKIFKTKYFDKISDDQWQVKKNIRDKVVFKKLNFMEDQFPFKKKFDIVFCRNVMIYFDQDTKTNLVNKFINFIKGEGWLFIGHSESLGNKFNKLQYIQPAIYKRL